MGLTAAHYIASCFCPGCARQKYYIKHQSIKQRRIQNQVSSLLHSKPNHRVRQSSLSPAPLCGFIIPHNTKQLQPKRVRAGPSRLALGGMVRAGCRDRGGVGWILSGRLLSCSLIPQRWTFFFLVPPKAVSVQRWICWGCSGTIWLARWTGDT